MMDPDPYVTVSGPVDARYLAFLETVSTLQPSLHRYSARMTGSVMDGEDVVQKALIRLYVDRFNRRDWDGVRELISADARLGVADRFAGKFADAPYFFNYNRGPWPWKLAVGEVDGEPVVVILRRGADTWTSYSVIRVNVTGQKIERIANYIHCPWVIPAAASVSLAGTT